MGRLSYRQVGALNRAVGHLYEPVSVNDFPDHVFQVAALALPHEVTGFSFLNAKTRQVDTLLSQPAQDALMRVLEHADDFYQMPGVADGSYFNSTSPTSFHDFTTVDEFKTRAMYEFFYKELGVLFDATINYHLQLDGTFCQLNLARKKRFSASERGLLGFLQPHLGQRFRQLIASSPDHPWCSKRMSKDHSLWLTCNSRGKILNFAATLPDFFRSIRLEWKPLLPCRWLDWFRQNLQPASWENPPEPFHFVGVGKRIVIHCLPNRSSGEHRLVFQSRFASSPTALLSSREREICRWLADGKTNSEIGTILRISRATVKNHVAHILSKLGVENRTAAAARLIEAGRMSKSFVVSGTTTLETCDTTSCYNDNGRR